MGIQINGQTDTVTAIDGSLNVGGDVIIPGVLTYDDVTNIDSIGVVTARSGVHVTSGSVGIGTDDPIGTNALTDNTSILAVGIATVGALHVNGNAYPSLGPLSNRNIAINGAMTVKQRGSSFTSLSGVSTYPADRFRFLNEYGTFDAVNSSTSPDGFSNSIRFDCTTANTSPAANDEIYVQQLVEAQDLQQLAYGSSAAKAITVSFYVRSNKTGDYGFWVHMPDASRQYATTYTISSADTWEYKTITIPGDSSGTINNDTGIGLNFRWYLGSGSSYSGTPASAWEVADANARTTTLNLADNTSNEWYLTGVQIEQGTGATPFEYRSFGDELARCQRYYVKSNSGLMGRFYNHGDVTRDIFFRIGLPVSLRDFNNSTTTAVGDISDGSNFSNWNYIQAGDPLGLLFRKNNIGAGGFVDINSFEVDNEL